ncbi:MAG: DMT family transporter [Actinomycetota bacterium]
MLSTWSSRTGPRWLGPVLVLVSAVLFSCSGVLTKAIEAGSWTILTWRGLVGGAGVAAYVVARRRGRPTREVFRLGPTGWFIAAVGAVGSVTFIVAFKHTHVANVSVIYATIPFVAAVLERLVRGEPIRPRTVTAAGASFVGVILVVGASTGSPDLVGDVMALAMVALNAIYMVLIRAFPNTDGVLAGAAGGPMLFAVGWIMTDPLAVSARDAGLLVLFGVVFAAATVCWIAGTMRIPAAESGLLGSAETPVAIALAWIVLSEAPPVASIAGALVVLVSLTAHSWPDLRSLRSDPTPAA